MQRPAAATRSRPRDAQATRELLLAAATEEFSEFGLAGARIDRIAERAGCNKRLIYVYFGDKERLFDTVLERRIETLDREVPLTPDDLAAFAAARFDYVVAHPQTARLAAWRAFERAEPTEAEVQSFAIKVAAIEGAQKSGKLNADITAIDLFAMVLRLTESWPSAPPALRSLAGQDPDAKQRIRQHRAALIDAVSSFTTPAKVGHGAKQGAEELALATPFPEGRSALSLNRVTSSAKAAMSPSAQSVSRSARRSRTACPASSRSFLPAGVRVCS